MLASTAYPMKPFTAQAIPDIVDRVLAVDADGCSSPLRGIFADCG